MVCLGFKPVAAGWKAETNPLSTPISNHFYCVTSSYADYLNKRFEPFLTTYNIHIMSC